MRPRVHLVHRRRVHGAVGVEAADEADVVHALRDVREQRRDVAPALAVFLELPGTPQQRRIALRELADDRAVALGQRLAVELLERRLRVERVDLARPADHEQEDDRLRLRREVRRLRRERIDALAAASARDGSSDASAIEPKPCAARTRTSRRVTADLICDGSRDINELVSIEQRQTEIRQRAAGLEETRAPARSLPAAAARASASCQAVSICAAPIAAAGLLRAAPRSRARPPA